MKLIDLNTNGGIGANSMYLEIGPFKIVVDSGMHPKEEGRKALPAMDKIPAAHLDAIILTHCHLDHLGSIPLLLRKFPSSPIIASIPTALLAPRMLHNSVSIMTKQKEERDIKEYPLFTRSDIAAVEAALLETPWRRTRVLERGSEELKVTLYPAGHVAGAASVMLEYKHRKIFITGDILFEEQWTIGGAQPPKEKIDTLIMETTRGLTDRQAPRMEEAERLLKAINETLQEGGPVLMPVFALGRMQEMLSLLAEAKRDGKLINSPIYCTGLGVDLIDYYDELTRRTGLVHFSKKMIKDLKVKSLRDYVDPHKGGLKDGGIYLVSSGMVAENTPSYSIAASVLDNPCASILFVGYCDVDTPGGALLKLKHDETYVFDALEYQAPLKARIERFDLSGHADRNELVDMAKAFNPRAIVLTHGDPEARLYFVDKLNKVGKVLDPVPLKEYEV